MRVLVHKRTSCRCGRCQARHTFSRHPDYFVRPKRCRVCGHTHFYRDKWMHRRGRQQKCECGGYHFPHRKGSKFCYEHPHAEFIHTERNNEHSRAHV